MAELVDIASVQDLLPAEAAEEGWNEEKITTYLDGGKTVYQVVFAILGFYHRTSLHHDRRLGEW